MPGLVVTMTGNNAGFTAMLNNSVAEAKTAGLSMQSNLRGNITAMEAKFASMFTKPMANIDKQIEKAFSQKAGDSVLLPLYQKRDALEKGSLAFQKNIETEKLRLRLMGSTQAAAVKKSEVAAAKAVDEAMAASNAEKIAQIIAQEKLAGRVYEDEKAAQLAAADILYAEEVAAAKAAQLLIARNAARGYGSAGLLGRGGHGGGSKAGVVQEIAVLSHETLQGRGTGRIIGSVMILGQRLGWLRKIIGTTADAHIDAALASEKLTAASAQESIVLEAKAVVTAEDAAATEADKIAANQAAAASLKRTMALHAETEALAEKAEMERVNAKLLPTMLGKLGLIGIIIAVALSPMALLIHYYDKLAQKQKNVFDLMFGGYTQSQQQTEAFDKQADAARKLATALDLVGKKQLTLAEISDRAVDSINAKAEAENTLAEASKKRADAQIEFDEKTGKISAREAARRKAAVDMAAIKDEQARKVIELTNVSIQRHNDLADAEKTLASKKSEYAASQKKTTEAGTEGSHRIKTLADLKREEETLAKWKDALQERQFDRENGKMRAMAESGEKTLGLNFLGVVSESVLEPKDAYTGEEEGKLVGTVDGKEMPAVKPEEIAARLKAAQAARQKMESGMSKDEVSAADAKRKMDDAEQSTLKLRQDVITSDKALLTQQTTGKSAADAAIATRRIQQQGELMPEPLKNLAVAKQELATAKADLADAKKKGAPKDEIEALSRAFFSKKQSLESMTEPASVAGLQKAKDDLEKSKAELAAAKNRGAPQDEIAVLQRDFFAKNKGLMEMQGTENKPAGLNERQRLGAFTAQGGNPLVPLHQRTNSLLQQLVNNSEQRTKNTQALNGVQH